MIPYIPLLRRPRKRRDRRQPGRSPVAPVGALELVSVIDLVTPGGGELDLTCVFDTTAEAPLVGIDAADPGKWSAVYGGDAYFGGSLEMIAFNQVRVVFFSAGDGPGSDAIDYAADPSDVADALGRQLGVVSGFPI